MENENYLHCQICSSYLLIRLINKEIQLYCLHCPYYANYPVDNQLFSKIFSKKNVQIPKYLEKVDCEFCKKTYCSNCYFYHQDVLSFIELDTHMDLYTPKIGKVVNQQYSNYNIRCEKCKKNYNSNFISLGNNSPSFQIIKRNVQKAESYYNHYFYKIKNEIINELQEKIDSIEEAFKANNEYHKNIFTLIHSLLKFAHVNPNNSIIKSLNDLSKFTFPNLEISHHERLEYKITKVINFFQNEYVISDQSRKSNPIYKTLDITIRVPGTPLKLSNNNILFYTKKDFTIYDGFDFHLIFNLKFKNIITAVCEINENKFLFGQFVTNQYPSIVLCELYARKYKLKKIKTLRRGEDNYVINDIYIIKSKQIIVLLDTEILILEFNYPYNIIKSMKIPTFFYSLQLKDQRILASVDINDNRDLFFFHLIFWNTITGEIKDHVIDAPSPYRTIIEINNQKLLLHLSGAFMIYNMITYQVQSIINMHLNFSYLINPKFFYIDNMITVMNKVSIIYYNEITFQKMFEIRFNERDEELINIFSLSNGTTLLVFDNLTCRMSMEKPKRG